MSPFARELEKRRVKHGWTMSELARQAQVGRPYLYRVLAGSQKPTIEWMQKVAKNIGMSVKLVIS